MLCERLSVSARDSTNTLRRDFEARISPPQPLALHSFGGALPTGWPGVLPLGGFAAITGVGVQGYNLTFWGWFSESGGPGCKPWVSHLRTVGPAAMILFPVKRGY